jgi:antibiotic biosynthesis monooxygenase (ABM) superfamily enzyme
MDPTNSRPGPPPHHNGAENTGADTDRVTPTDATHSTVRWKTWLVTTAAIYPTVTLLSVATKPVQNHLPLPLRLAILIPTTIAITQWLLMPYLHRKLRSWLTR